MKGPSQNTIKSVFTSFILIVAIIEFLLLVRHDVIKKIMISRGLLKMEVTDRPDYHCVLGWENTLEKMDYKADACFFGNSITFHSDFQKDYPHLKIVNLGYSGDIIEGMLFRYKQIASVKPDKIFIMAGHNDLTNPYLTMERFGKLYNQLIDSIQGTNPNSSIFLESILPVNHQMKHNIMSSDRIIEANRIIKTLAGERSLVYVDLFSLYADKNNELPIELTTDGIHLKPSSYKMWSDKINQYLE